MKYVKQAFSALGFRAVKHTNGADYDPVYR